MQRQSGAESGRRLLSLLFAFTPEHPIRSVAELAADADVPVSSVYRYISLLRDEGILDVAGPGSYRLTDRLIGLAEASRAGRAPLIEIGSPLMEALAEAIDETVLIVRRSGFQAYCIDRVESTRPVRLQFNRGQAMALHAGSAARILLAHMPAKDREEYLATLPPDLLERSGDLLSPAGLEKIVKDTWTESFEEVDEGIWGTAAGIFAGGELVASISTAAPIFRADAKRRRDIIRQVREAADGISRELAQRH